MVHVLGLLVAFLTLYLITTVVDELLHRDLTSLRLALYAPSIDVSLSDGAQGLSLAGFPVQNPSASDGVEEGLLRITRVCNDRIKAQSFQQQGVDFLVGLGLEQTLACRAVSNRRIS